MFRWRQRSAVLVALIIAFGTAACGSQTQSQSSQPSGSAPQASEQPEPSDDGEPIDPTLTTLTIGVAQEPQTFDPNVNVAAVSAYRYYGNIYEGLVRYAPDGTIEPLLAADWEISDDGLRYEFTLRDDAMFSDGTPFNAEAVAFAIERLRTIGVGAVAFFAPITEVNILDEFSVEFVLEQPYAPLLSILAGWQGAIFVSPTAVEENAEGDDLGQAWLNYHTAGTGPFVLESWEPNVRIVLTRNEHFREPADPAAIQTMVYAYIGEPATLRQQIAAGDIDIAEELTPAILEPVSQADGVTTSVDVSYAGFGTHVYFNLTKEPFDNPNLRRAIAHALDYDRLASVWGGTAVPAHGFLPQDYSPWFSADDAVQYHQDLDAAAEELEAGGYDSPIDPPLQFQIIWQAGQTAQRDMAQLMAEDLAQIGIQLTIEEREIVAWREAIWTKNFDLAFFGLPLRYGDPDSIASLSFISTEVRDRGFNPGIIDERIDELTLAGRQASDPEERQEIYNEMQQIITEEAYFLPLVERKHAWAARDNVSGITWNSYYGQVWRGADIRKTEADS